MRYVKGRFATFVLRPLSLVALFANLIVGHASFTVSAQTRTPLSMAPRPAINSATNRVYRVQPDGTLTVTGATTQESATLAIPGAAVGVVINIDTNLLYVLTAGGALHVMDGENNTIVASVPVGSRGTAIGINTITNRIYVGTADGLAVFDAVGNRVIATLPHVYANPDIVVDEAINRIYTSSQAEDRVNVVDGFNNAAIASIPVGDRPLGLAVNPLTGRVYVANSGTPDTSSSGDSVSVIDSTTNVVDRTIPLAREDAIALSFDRTLPRLIVTMSAGDPIVIDTDTNSVVTSNSAPNATASATTSTVKTMPAAIGTDIARPVQAVSTPGAAIYNLVLATDGSPDLTDLNSLVSSTTALWPTNREKVWALYYWSHILKRQTGPIVRHGFEITDPIRNLVDFGYTMCSTVTGINQALYEVLGLRHQYWDICNHTVSAVEYDGAFHMIDSSMSNLVTKDDGVTLASVQEAAANSARLVREHSLYSTSPNGFLTGTDTIRPVSDLANPRTAAAVNGYYRVFCEATLKLRNYYYNWNAGHRYVLNLRDNESYTRSFAPLGTSSDYWVSSEHIDSPDPANTFQNDSSNKFGLRGNGRWTFSPSLAQDSWARAAYQATNINAVAEGLAPVIAGQTAEVIYKVQSGNAITSQAIQAQFSRTDPLATAAIAISINHGATWLPVADAGAAVGAAIPVSVNLRNEVNGAYETLVRIQMAADLATPRGITLTSLAINTLTQVNAKALPRLNIGRNEIYVGAGDQSDTMVLWPDLRGDLWRNDAYDSSNVGSQPVTVPRPYTSVVYPAVLSQNAYLTYRMDAPNDITRIVYGGRLFNAVAGSYIDFLHSFDGGVTWIPSYRLTDTSLPHDVIHYETVTNIPAGVRTVLFKYVFHNTGTTAGVAAGLYAVRMEANYRPSVDAPAATDIVFRWKEVRADRTTVARSHKQRVTAFPFSYIIDVGGSDHPIMDSVTVNTVSAGDSTPQGYSDGTDVGGQKYVYSRRIEGTNLAEHKPYSISRPPSAFQDSADASNTTILTDGIVGSPVTGGFSYWAGQCWTANTTVDFVVNLQTVTTPAAVRAHLFGYPGWDALKGQVQDKVEVLTSLDGATYTSRGFLQTSLWKKDVPINYMLQDDETATGWNFELPLVPAIPARFVKYHVTPKRTLCVSELQVLDALDYSPFDVRIALPPSYGGAPLPDPVPPTVTLTSPLGNTTLVAPQQVTLSADAFDSDGGIYRVDFYAGATLLGRATAAPFTATWVSPAPGDYLLTAKAIDISGAVTTSAPITFTVAPLPGNVLVPDVVGLTQDAATTALAGGQLTAGPLTLLADPIVPAGRVIAEIPAAGSSVPPGTAISLVVSKGLVFAAVPDITGQTTAAAASALTAVGLKLGAQTIASSTTVPQGLIISQDPAPAESVPADTSVSVVVSSGPPLDPVPASWSSQDIGAVGLPGSASLKNSATYVVSGAGADIWGTADAFQFVYQPLDGDGDVVAQVTSLTNTDVWTKAGVMIRADATPGSPHAIMLVSPGKGNAFQRRRVAAGTSTSTAALQATPRWIKVTRRGDTMTAYQSVDGTTWSVVGSDTIPMPARVLAGLAVSSHVTTALATATFDHVTVSTITVSVPRVVGLTQADATTTLTNAGLTLGAVTTMPSDTIAAGIISSQTPDAGVSVTSRTAVSVVISSGPAAVIVPQVIGLTQSGATAALTAAQLSVGTITTATSITVPAGTVIDQAPAAGESVATGTPVALVISAGPAPVTVPNVVNLTQQQATASLTASGLVVGTITTAASATVAAGSVISQAPSAGAVVSSGTAIALTVSSGPPATAWTDQDVGSVGLSGSSSFASGTYTVSGAGADIWGTTDAFHYVYQPLNGNGVIVARVVSVQNVSPWVKAGVMIRRDTSAGSPHAMMMVTPGKGNNFQRRRVAGGTSLSTTGAAVAAPYWVKLVRFADTITAYQSVDGTTWSKVGTETITMPTGVLVGLAVSSHISATLATATFDQITIRPPDVSELPPGVLPSPWQTSDVGAVGLVGQATFDGASYSVTGAGADIWGTADAFRYVYQPLTGDGQITARVVSVQNISVWVKAGVMFRTDLTPGSPQAMMMVTPGKGNNFQRRLVQGGVSSSTTGAMVTAPYWVRLTRTGNTIVASQSVDGVAWTTVGSATINMPPTVMVGLAVSSHTTSALATATFGQVSIVNSP
jgi:YVTN family beta-propeller protein